MTPNQPPKHAIKDAQAKHLSALFGEETPPPQTQQAGDQQRARAGALKEAADKKTASLSEEEAARLEDLRQRHKSAPAPVAEVDTPAPPKPAAVFTPTTPPPSSKDRADPSPSPPPRATQPPTGLHELSERNDLAAAALRNMQTHARRTAAPAPNPPPSRPATAPPPAADPAAPPPPTRQPGSPPGGPTRRQAPTPEELERMLRQLSQRQAARGARPGAPERGESSDTFDAPPAPPEEPPEKQAEKQAEILRELQAKEATAQQQARPVPQPDQERADVTPVQATVPIKTDGNAVSSGPLHQALVDLQQAMTAHAPEEQVAGINKAQQNLPHHPMSQSETPR